MIQQHMVQRVEERVDMKVTALLVGRHGRLGVETGLTENVSSRGARVISSSEWLLDDTILLALPGFHFTSAARVAYCAPLGDGRFGTGLEFVGTREHLEITALATALQSPQT
ncbi:MAG: PilZ domain-containing protein [Candidatus Acidiferrales bacterium]